MEKITHACDSLNTLSIDFPLLPCVSFIFQTKTKSFVQEKKLQVHAKIEYLAVSDEINLAKNRLTKTNIFKTTKVYSIKLTEMKSKE